MNARLEKHSVRTLEAVMRLGTSFLATAVLAVTLSALTSPARATVIREEHVTGGNLDLVWVPGFVTNRVLIPGTLLPSDPAYANPSGDHTVGVLVNATPDSGGIALTTTDPGGQADYVWEADFFTGDGSTRRGLALRADPSNNFQNTYLFVLFAGMSQIAFRKLVGQVPTTLGSWFTFQLASGVPAQNTWHHMKVIAVANSFRCFWDGVELTDPNNPIVDPNNPYLTGWVGAYNFNFSLGGVPVLFDNFVLSNEQTVPARSATWGRIKALYR
jgi:hypothetical protein